MTKFLKTTLPLLVFFLMNLTQESSSSGETCSKLRVHCAPNNPCQAKGVDMLKGTKGCENLVGDYKCICKTGYDGKHCEVTISSGYLSMSARYLDDISTSAQQVMFSLSLCLFVARLSHRL